jgi:hypothetical protein
MQQTSALQGMSGIGEFALASFLARGCTTRRASAAGIIWIELRQEPSLLSAVLKTAAAVQGEPIENVDLEEATTRGFTHG